MNEPQNSPNFSPPELTETSGGSPVPDSQSTDLSKRDAEHSLDHVDRLAPEGFPNSPQGWAKVLPATLPNINYVLNEYGITVRYDCIKKKLRIAIPGHTGTSDNADNTAITVIISLVTLNGMATGQVPALVEAIGDRNLYNPVADWITSKPWDGVDRLPAMFNTLREREGYSAQLKRILLYKWLLSAVAAALKPTGFKARGVLTFQGPQGIGKTSWIMALVSSPVLRDMLIKVDHHLDPHNKDSILGAITHWIVEIGELDSSFRKSDVSRLKGVLTSDSDKVRRPYAKSESEYQRRTVFAATVNEENFLVDHTGNTRWWTLPLASIDFEHGIDMQQVFAQLASDFHAGAQWWLTKDEEALLEKHNSEHRSVSLMRDRLMEILDLSRIGQPGNPSMGTVDMLAELGYDHPTNGDTKELTAVLRELLGNSKKVNGTQKWRIPRRLQTKRNFPGLDDDDKNY
jgi:putative DNA primase/helicase